MSDLYGFVQQDNVSRASDGTKVGVRVTRDGSLMAVPWVQALCLEGRCFGVGFGDAGLSATTVGTFGGGGVDLQEYDLLQTIPASSVVLPVYFQVVLEVVGNIAAVDILLAYGATAAAHSTHVNVTPVNMRPGSPNASVCTVETLADAAGTTMVPSGWIFREGTTALTGSATNPQPLGQYCWSVVDTGFAPVIEGLRYVAGFASAQASTGYMHYVWVELPVSAIN